MNNCSVAQFFFDSPCKSAKSKLNYSAALVEKLAAEDCIRSISALHLYDHPVAQANVSFITETLIYSVSKKNPLFIVSYIC